MRLERTGFISEVKFHLETEGKPPYMSFSHIITTTKNECRNFTRYLLHELKKTKPEIKEFGYSAGKRRDAINAYLILNPTVEIYNKQDFLTETLNAINTATKEYLHQNHIDDPFRNK